MLSFFRTHAGFAPNHTKDSVPTFNVSKLAHATQALSYDNEEDYWVPMQLLFVQGSKCINMYLWIHPTQLYAFPFFHSVIVWGSIPS